MPEGCVDGAVGPLGIADRLVDPVAVQLWAGGQESGNEVGGSGEGVRGVDHVAIVWPVAADLKRVRPRTPNRVRAGRAGRRARRGPTGEGVATRRVWQLGNNSRATGGVGRYRHRVGVDEPAELIIRSNEDPGVFVRLHDRFFPDEYGIGFSVEAHVGGPQDLHARIGAEVWVWDDSWLPGFLAGLAEDFRGWSEERLWRTNHLAVRAVFHSRGHVALTWTLQPWTTQPDTWQASITTWVEAGAQMSALAADMNAFLPMPRPGTAWQTTH